MERVGDTAHDVMSESELVTSRKKGETMYMNSQQKYKRR